MSLEENKWFKKAKVAGKEVWWFISSPVFLKNCAMMVGVGLLLTLMVFLWLRWYTNHGESITVDNYIGEQLEMATRKASKKSFRVAVSDSLFVVGKEGGMILEQNPKAGSKVKKERTIYVTISKYSAEMIPVKSLPIIYGKEFENVRRLLEKRYELTCRVTDKVFDSGPENHILKMIYENDTLVSKNNRRNDYVIPKGATVDFIISTRAYAPVESPDLVCKNFETASFLIRNSGLTFGNMYTDNTVTDTASAIVWRQQPPHMPGKRLQSGDTIDVYLTQIAPANCQ